VKVCSIERCGQKAIARGWCNKHWARWRNNGDPLLLRNKPKTSRNGKCHVDGCNRDIMNLGYCATHYSRYRRHGHPQENVPILPKNPLPDSCSIPSCQEAPLARSMCRKHWSRWRTHGDPLGRATYKTPSDWEKFWLNVKTGGLDECWPWVGNIDIAGYGRFKPSFGAYTRAHRYVYSQFVGPIPNDKPFIDHKCRKRDCVNPGHLRAVTAAQNSQNVSTKTNSKSGLRGVRQTRTGTWEGRVTRHGINYSTGQFATIEQAHKAVQVLRLELFTHNEDDRQEQPGTGVQVQVTQRGSNA
jgi:hypothetical protein